MSLLLLVILSVLFSINFGAQNCPKCGSAKGCMAECNDIDQYFLTGSWKTCTYECWGKGRCAIRTEQRCYCATGCDNIKNNVDSDPTPKLESLFTKFAGKGCVGQNDGILSNTPSLYACINECIADAQCISFEYNTNLECHVSYTCTAPDTDSAMDLYVYKDKDRSPVYSFSLHTGYGCIAQNEEVLTDISLFHCQQQCALDSDCVSLEYYPLVNQCHISYTCIFKYARYLNKNKPDLYIYDEKINVAPSYLFTQHLGHGCSGQNHQVFKDMTLFECFEQCVLDTTCISFEYFINSNECALSNSCRFGNGAQYFHDDINLYIYTSRASTSGDAHFNDHDAIKTKWWSWTIIGGIFVFTSICLVMICCIISNYQGNRKNKHQRIINEIEEIESDNESEKNNFM